MKRLNVYLFILFIFLLSNAFLIGQTMNPELHESHLFPGIDKVEDQYIEAFYKQNNATSKEKFGTHCELSLLYYQYNKMGKQAELNSAFQTVFDTYKNSQKLNVSKRLFEVDYESEDYVNGRKERIRHFEEDYTWVWQGNKPKNQGNGDKPIGGDGDVEKATNCTNSDFEDGNASGWALGHGTYNGGGVPGININNPSPNMGTMNSTGGQHCMMGPGAGMDNYTNGVVPRVFPGGGDYSLRVGDQGSGKKASRAIYTFTVTPQTELFIYHYAAILQDPNHSPTQQPFMQITLTVGSLSDPCGYYYQAASSNAPGYFSGTSSVRYKPWTTVSVSLSAFIGQTATLEFITADCSPSAHFGYAYIDAECSGMPSMNQTVINCFDPTPTVYGPPGATSYSWSGPGIVGPSNVQDIVVNAPGTYTLTVTPATSSVGVNCNYVVQAIVVEHLGTIAATFNAIPDEVCLGTPISFASNYTTTGDAGAIDSINWDWGNGVVALDADANLSYTFPDPDVYTVELAVITTNGCVDTVQQTVTVHPMPVADFVVDSVCYGNVTNIQNNSSIITTNGDAITSWNWDFGDGNTSASQNPTNPTYANENVYNISLVVESGFGCRDSLIQTALVYPNPIANFAATNVCIDDISQFTDMSFVSNAQTTNVITDWSWDFDDGNNSSSQSPLHTFLQDGVYNVELTVLTNNGCTHDTIVSVGVYPNPVVDITHPDVCLEAATVFSDNSTVNNTQTTSSIVGWNWNFGDGTTSNVQNPSHTYLTNDTYEVILTVTTDHGCIDVDTFSVVIFPNPVADFSIDSVCLGTASIFTDLSSIDNSNGDNIVSWAWDFGDGQTSISTNPVNVYADDNLYNVSLTVVSNHNCSTTVSKVTAIYPNPVADFQVNDVCFGFPSNFYDQSSINNSHTQNNIVTWAWDFADGNTTNVKSPTHNYDDAGTYNVNLTVTSNNDCSTTQVIPVKVFPEPIANFKGANLEGCAPLCMAITSTSTIASPSSIANFQWTLSDGTIYNTSTPLLSDCIDIKGGEDLVFGLKLKVTSDHGCVDEHQADDYIRVYHNPIAKFYYTPPKLDIINSKVYFHNTSRYADSYLWNIGDFTSTNEENPIIDFPEVPNTYYTELIAYTDAGCSDTALAIVDVLDRIVFYIPNSFTPDNDEFNEEFRPVFASGFDPQTYTFQVFNRWGEVLFESHDTEKGWDGSYGVGSGETVKEGTYIWKLSFKETMSDKRHTHSGYVNLLK